MGVVESLELSDLMSIAETNPYTYCHNWLWSALENEDTFCALVPERNRVKVCSFYNPDVARTFAEGDSPNVMIALRSIKHDLDYATNTTILVLSYAINILTAGMDAGEIEDIMWAILKGIVKARSELVNDVFLHDARFDDTELEYVVKGRTKIVTACVVSLYVHIDNQELLE